MVRWLRLRARIEALALRDGRSPIQDICLDLDVTPDRFMKRTTRLAEAIAHWPNTRTRWKLGSRRLARQLRDSPIVLGARGRLSRPLHLISHRRDASPASTFSLRRWAVNLDGKKTFMGRPDWSKVDT
jgi:hypothetical protein